MNNERTLDGAIDAVCNFWIEKMTTPGNWDNGDKSESGGFTSMLANVLSIKAQSSITQDKIEAFRKSLTEIIKEEIKDRDWDYICDVDYDPSRNLANACRAADIPMSSLPCKSHTNIKKDFTVQSRYKYGSPFVQLY